MEDLIDLEEEDFCPYLTDIGDGFSKCICPCDCQYQEEYKDKDGNEFLICGK